MKISPETLADQAEATGFRPDMVEKVALLLQLLDAVRSHPFLKDRLVLKGGTALNLFVFDVPRLSVDIDLNYVGAVDRETMLLERPKVEEALQAVFSREGYTVRRVPTEHAGGKWQLRYPSAGGQGGNLEVDLNFMFRIPLWPVQRIDSRQAASGRPQASRWWTSTNSRLASSRRYSRGGRRVICSIAATSSVWAVSIGKGCVWPLSSTAP